MTRSIERTISESTNKTAVITPPTEIRLESLDMLAWSRGIVDVIALLTETSPTTNKIYLGPDNLSISIAKGEEDTLREVLSSAIFLGRVRELAINNLKSFSEVNRGDKSYSEIVFYKVEKYTSPNAPTPIQNIWIPNINQIDPVEYVDTQVKYNKQYTYKVIAYSAVIGTKYYYDTTTFGATFPPVVGTEPCVISSGDTTIPPDHVHIIENWKVKANPETPESEDHTHHNLIPVAGEYKWTSGNTDGVNFWQGIDQGDHIHKYRVDSDGNGTTLCHDEILGTTLAPTTRGMEFFQIDVITEPTVELIKTELFSFEGSILDDPPMIPDIDFTPYIGIDNKITINMHAQIGEYTNKPVILNSEDSDFIDSLLLSRGLPSGSAVTYKTDDETAAFEIYRTQDVPTSYSDFSNSLIANVSTLQRDSFNAIYSWNYSYKDTLTPNEEYYYMVRSVDIHGHRSYPSPVYKIMMVNDSGAVYPLVEVVDMMPPTKPKMSSKEFKKFLQIVPSFPQSSIDYEGSNLLTSAGNLTSSALGKGNGIVLGVVSPKLFGNSESGQTFKIRIISKHTGKKLDLNVTFKVENELRATFRTENAL